LTKDRHQIVNDYTRTTPKAFQPKPRGSSAANWRKARDGGTRADSTDRGAMIAMFSRRFPGLSAREIGKLFDKYRLNGCIEIHWNVQTSQYVILFDDD
jgi:hypothetical protein